MSVLIKGMKMPKEQALRIILKNGQLFADHGVRFTEYEAVEVPPHGPLIDMNEALHTFSELDPYRRAFEKMVLIEAEEAEHEHTD